MAKKKSAIKETGKFVFRTVLLVGIPAVLAQVIQEQPELGLPIGAILMVIDKLVHELPNEYRGLVPF